MKAEEFRRLTAELEKLTPHQKQLLTDRLRGSGHATDVRALIESRVGAAPVCPHCQHQQVSRWGKSSGLQRYRCGACHATFNALTGTPLARLRKKEQWLTYACQMTEGQSVRKSAAACDVHRNTAFRWRHRFLELPNSQRATLLSGIAEADETVFLESFKGKKRGLSRAPRKRGGKAAKRGLSEEQIPVLICRDRAGGTADFVLARADKAHIQRRSEADLGNRCHSVYRWRTCLRRGGARDGHHASSGESGAEDSRDRGCLPCAERQCVR